MNAGGAIARPTYGTVQAGDIKYRDVNGDMRIDDEDFTVIGNTHARFAYGLKVTLTWRNFELFAYMSAQTGGDQRLSERRVLCGLRAQRQVSGTPDRPLGLRSQPRDRYARYSDLSASDGQLVGDDAQLRQDVDVLARPAELLLDSGCPALLPFGRQADEDAAPERRDDLCARHRHPAALAFAGSDDPERGQRVPVRMGTPRSETEILTAKSRSLL